MTPNQEKLVATLKYIFQIDRGDLDFGIYRILNQKHTEISDFLENKLLTQVNEVLSQYADGDRVELQNTLDAKVREFRDNGFSDEQIEDNNIIKDLRAKLAATIDVAALESEVFSHLVHFFERYYEEGDFISKRRYKEGVYAIPYEGEEVKLHWANHDQYYIKTSEQFRNYSFKAGDKKVHFKIKEAETDRNNNKSQKDRRFVLSEEIPFEEVNGELNIHFHYVGLDEKKKQDDLNKEAVGNILDTVPDGWKELLSTSAPTEKQADRTLLEKHLTTYTAKYTFDYFIHKDLGTFLKRELDFFIKNEIVHLDDIENETAPRVEQYLAKVKAVRKIAGNIITMLAQLEDFQKRLWEKKKFVVGTGYCVTLDLVPEQYYEAILQCDAQLASWKEIGFIDDNTELSAEYLKDHPTLTIDTKYFPDIKDELLATFDNIDDGVNGVLINSDNFGALNFIVEKYSDLIDSIYIDPPYNTDSSKILYKNNYEHSSWLSLIDDRIRLAKKVLSNEGILCITIDDYEAYRLWMGMEQIFGQDNYLGTAAIRINPGGRKSKKELALQHEYAMFYAKSGDVKVAPFIIPIEEKSHSYYQDENGQWCEDRNLRKEGQDSLAKEGSPRYYSIYYNPETGQISTKTKHQVEILPIDTSGNKRIWRKDKDDIDQLAEEGRVFYKETANGPQIYFRFYGGSEGETPKTFWDNSEYSASEYGSSAISKLFGNVDSFSFPKSPYATKDCIRVTSSKNNNHVLDFFAGSATTGHAVLKLNRDNNEKEAGSGQRKYMLVEMGEYFETVTKPRMLKVVYSDDWSNGKPQDEGATGTLKHVIKYFKLESYEDTLNNLELKRNDDQDQALQLDDNFYTEYMLRYQLDVEARESLLSLETFKNPFSYTIKLSTDVVGEMVDTPVDLVETFNYLIGLKVATIQTHEGIKMVEGENLAGEKILVLWRNIHEVDNDALNDFFNRQALSTTDFEFQKIYVNGDNTLENLRQENDGWKVVLIEEEFKKRMFNE